MIPWKLVTKFDDEQHLFSNIIDTKYVVNSFTCSCGHVDLLIGYLYDEIEYTCPICKNSVFYDANNAWRNIDYFLSYNNDIEFYSYDISTCKDSLEARYVTKIPTNIDFMRKKVLYSGKKLCSLLINDKGDIKESSIIKENEDINNELKTILVNSLNKKPDHFNLPTSEYERLNLDSASFFLKNKDLNDYGFYNWAVNRGLTTEHIAIEKALHILANDRKEKSVKRMIYNNYLNYNRKNKGFNPSLIEIFTRDIKDSNILVKLLELDIYNCNLSTGYIILLIQILKKRYSEKQILVLFVELSKNNSRRQYFVDMMHAISDIDDIDNFFKVHKKVKCNISSLHDAAVEYTRKCLQKRLSIGTIYNEKHQLKPCIQIDNYEIKLPQNGIELLDWAETLHNCMASYYEMIVKNETSIYGFFIKNKIEFAVEISEGNFIQASRTCNEELLPKQQEILQKWLKKYFPQEELSYVA